MSGISENTDPGVGPSGTLPRRPRPPNHAMTASTLSMRDKAVRKRRANRQHNANFSCGHVDIDEDVLNRSGIRGRKRHLLHCVLATLVIVTLMNAAVTAWLIYLLGVSHTGLATFELADVDHRSFLRLFLPAELETMTMEGDGAVGARFGQDLQLQGPEIQIQVPSRHPNSNTSSQLSGVHLKDDILTITTDRFDVNNMTFDLPSLMDSYERVNLEVDSVTTTQVAAQPDTDDVYIESINRVQVTGSEVGVSSGRSLNLTGSDVTVTSYGDVIIQGHRGVYLDPSITTINITNSDNTTSVVPKVKLCACASGKLFATDSDDCHSGTRTRDC